MREIKFRAWDTKLNKMIRTLLAWGKREDNGKTWTAHSNDFNKEDGYLWLPSNLEIMQYTGLKDKNGVEIYEGDIVLMLCTDWTSKSPDDPISIDEYMRDKADKYVVDFNSGECMFTLQFGEAGGYEHGFYGFRPNGFIEVIGNIYENPELLESDK